jgi:hypothetical protein
MKYLRMFESEYDEWEGPLPPYTGVDIPYDAPWEYTVSNFEEAIDDYEGPRRRSDFEPPDIRDLDWKAEKEYPASQRTFTRVADIPNGDNVLKAGPDCILEHDASKDLYLLNYGPLLNKFSDKRVEDFLGPYMFSCSYGYAPPGDSLDSDFWGITSECLATDLYKEPENKSLFGGMAKGEGLLDYSEFGAILVKIDEKLAQAIVDYLEDSTEGYNPHFSTVQYRGQKLAVWQKKFLISTREGKAVAKLLQKKFKVMG